MKAEELWDQARAVALELPGAEPWVYSPQWEAVKVCGKWFVVMVEVHDTPVVNLAVLPEDGLALTQRYAEITPGWHMNKDRWISVHPGGEVDLDLLKELVEESYLNVVSRLPKLVRQKLARHSNIHQPRR
ncbi:hypothetical protein HMPREF0576_0803 [Mobiluncus holmesii ATCC 35242]|uniref:MmcQ/YjbR family DNA-binding protein n=2 Tax=Mobiluncus TaxID=2050 RepID=E6M398_9ACTO|nr:MmcQ/YjbR family DNA-binding protein [Mobiluncus holmesii]EFU82434.1 hypothetical protein HMPREF0576_0803 [Mobiluncus holmesii ATCC 35242]STY88560.1 Uncharacterized protein conserved in bacteria [Mobiluncus holmesii]